MREDLPVEELEAGFVGSPAGPAPLSGLLLLDPLELSALGVVVELVEVGVEGPPHVERPSCTMVVSSSSGGASPSLGHSSSELLGGFGGGAFGACPPVFGGVSLGVSPSSRPQTLCVPPSSKRRLLASLLLRGCFGVAAWCCLPLWARCGCVSVEGMLACCAVFPCWVAWLSWSTVGTWLEAGTWDAGEA